MMLCGDVSRPDLACFAFIAYQLSPIKKSNNVLSIEEEANGPDT
jgi:hypothetical protein